MRAETADLQCLYRQLKIIYRACRRCEVHHGIEPAGDVQVFCDVLLDESETVIAKVMRDVFGASGQQVVEDDHLVPFA